MKITEIFRSIEGEGVRAGQIAIFVRAYGCNCSCSYCDSEYACREGEYTEMTVKEIVEEVKKLEGSRVTFTGGEPLLQADSIDLIDALCDAGYEVNVETNGSLGLSCLNFVHDRSKIIVTMDYKTLSSGMTERMMWSNLIFLKPQDVIKFVVGTREDLDQMKDILLSHPTMKATPYVSPVFGKIELREIAEYLLENNLDEVKMQVQLHKLVWNPEMRGV